MTTRNLGLHVRLLGIPLVHWDGDALRLPSQKSRAILCYLVTRRRPATRDELAELLWPVGSAANLRPELHRLRSLPGAYEWLDVGTSVAADADTDLADFERAVHDERFDAALALHPPSEELMRGLAPPHAPAFGDWLDLERMRTQSLYRDALRGHALTLEQHGAFGEALDRLRELIDLDPLDESAYRAAMRCEYRRGHVDAALVQFQACRRVLAEELGADPLDETLELARAIERGASMPDVEAPATRRMPLTLLRPPTLVGREREWARLEAAWEAGQAINVSGPPGIGKTRLMMDFVRSKGTAFVLEGRPGDKVVPYSSLARALRAAIRDHPTLIEALAPWVRSEVARILPDLVQGEPASSGSEQDGTRFFEAIVHLMGLLRGLVRAIVVDDLQYLDARSFEVGIGAQARLLAVGTDRQHARLVAAFRAGELPEAFEQGLALAVGSGMAVHIEVMPLDAASLHALLETLDMGDAATLAPSLQRLTGGNPQFVVEALKRVHERGDSPYVGADQVEAPETVASIIGGRLIGLGQLALRLVRAVAILDGPADIELLASVIGTSPFDATEAIADLERAQVLRDGSFVHDLVMDTVAALTPAAERTLLHRRIAAALERSDSDPLRLAHHWHEAGEPERARRHQLAAARGYQEAGLEDDAIELLMDVLGAGAVLPKDDGAGTAQRLREYMAHAQRALDLYTKNGDADGEGAEPQAS